MSDGGPSTPAQYGKVIAKAWRDPAFKAKLMADPRAILAEAGVAIPAGVTVKVLEDTTTHLNFVLPPKPTGQLSDEALDKAASGADAGGLCIASGKYTKAGLTA